MDELDVDFLRKIIEYNVGKYYYLREEIAFLGLTSKIEIQLRDKIAFGLYVELKDRYIIAREWNYCDLAILDKTTHEPLMLIEFKSCYSCDLIKPSTTKEYVNEIKSDLNKSIKLTAINSKTQIYSVLFVTKPKHRIPSEFLKIVKYSKSINTAFNKFGNYEVIEMIGEANLRNHYNILAEGKIKNDKAFGIECGFDYFIISPENNVLN